MLRIVRRPRMAEVVYQYSRPAAIGPDMSVLVCAEGERERERKAS